MRSMHRFKHYAVVAVAVCVLAACANQKEPAQKLIGDIDAQVNAASADAAKYAPDQLIEVQKKLGDLKASFDKKDYKAVVDGGPAAMSAAQSLPAVTAAKKDQLTKGFNEQWTSLSAMLPGDANAIQSRIDFLSKKENKKLAAGVDLDSAKASLGDASSLWSKAQAAFAAGNVSEAVTTAKEVKTKFEALAASMKLDFSQPAAVQDTAPGT